MGFGHLSKRFPVALAGWSRAGRHGVGGAAPPNELDLWQQMNSADRRHRSPSPSESSGHSATRRAARCWPPPCCTTSARSSATSAPMARVGCHPPRRSWRRDRVGRSTRLRAQAGLTATTSDRGRPSSCGQRSPHRRMGPRASPARGALDCSPPTSPTPSKKRTMIEFSDGGAMRLPGAPTHDCRAQRALEPAGAQRRYRLSS